MSKTIFRLKALVAFPMIMILDLAINILLGGRPMSKRTAKTFMESLVAGCPRGPMFDDLEAYRRFIESK